MTRDERLKLIRAPFPIVRVHTASGRHGGAIRRKAARGNGSAAKYLKFNRAPTRATGEQR